MGTVPGVGEMLVGGKLVKKATKALDSVPNGNKMIEEVGKNINNVSRNAKNAANKLVKNQGTSAAERSKNLNKGIPENQIGPSGKPKILVVSHPTKKKAKDAAKDQAGKGGSVMHHPSPNIGNPHYHPIKPNGVKIRTHHEYPG